MRLASLILANVWMYGTLVPTTLALIVLFFPWILACVLAGQSVEKAARRGIWIYGRVCTIVARPAVRMRIDNPRALCDIPPAVIVANHQSFYDTYLLGAQDADNIGMLIKEWPFRKLFFFRPLMRTAGYIATGNEPLETTMARCRNELSTGGHLFGFPEGTRSRDGSLGRFHSGLFALATETGCKIVPMIIRNSRAILPKGSRLFRSGTVRVEFLPPIDASLFAHEPIPHIALRRHAYSLMAERLKENTEPT